MHAKRCAYFCVVLLCSIILLSLDVASEKVNTANIYAGSIAMIVNWLEGPFFLRAVIICNTRVRVLYKKLFAKWCADEDEDDVVAQNSSHPWMLNKGRQRKQETTVSVIESFVAKSEIAAHRELA